MNRAKVAIAREAVYASVDSTDLLLLLGPLHAYAKRKRQLSQEYSLSLYCIEHPVRQLFGHVVDKFFNIPICDIYQSHKAKLPATLNSHVVLTNKLILSGVGSGLHALTGITKRLGANYNSLAGCFPSAEEGAPEIIDYFVKLRTQRTCGTHAFIMPGDRVFSESLLDDEGWHKIANSISDKMKFPLVSPWETAATSFTFLTRMSCFLPKMETIWDLAYWLASSRFFIGEESWVAHLAIALGVPSVILFPVETRSEKYRYMLNYVRYVEFRPSQTHVEQDLLETALAVTRQHDPIC